LIVTELRPAVTTLWTRVRQCGSISFTAWTCERSSRLKRKKTRFLKAISSQDDYHDKCAKGDDRCFFALIDELFAVREEAPGKLIPVIAKVLMATLAETQWLQSDEKLIKNALARGGAQRISLSFQHQHFERHQDTPFAEWLCDVLERWVVSQHLYTATYRFDGGSQRLRFTFDENGLEFIADEPLQPVVSLDHLEAALSLMSECGIVEYDATTDLFSSGS